MKNTIILFATIFIASCSCKKPTSQTTLNAKLESECPQDGTCTIEILENKSIAVKQDEFGSIYYTIEENLNKSRCS